VRSTITCASQHLVELPTFRAPESGGSSTESRKSRTRSHNIRLHQTGHVPNGLRRGHLDIRSQRYEQRGTMTTRKPKPTLESMIELQAEKLQLATVTVERKAPARDAQARHATELAAASLPRRGKITLH
jgi:hypothetical protein